jgi:DNA-directed RNA polymerase specialized sigma24 family protein
MSHEDERHQAWSVDALMACAKPAPERGTVFQHELLVAPTLRTPRSSASWTRFMRAVLQRTLRHLLGPAAPLDELLDHALFEAARSWPPARSEEPLSVWGQRIAVDVAVRHLTRARERAEAEVPRERPGSVREVLANVYARLRDSRPEEQIAFALLELHGRSASEAALILRLPSTVVRQRAARARRRIAFAARTDKLLTRYLCIAARVRELASRAGLDPVAAFA